MDEGAEGDPGTVVAGRYRLHELVGSGGMGSVWRATDELLGREVAVKELRLDRQPGVDPELMRVRTMREARIAAALHHPNVVTIFDVVTEGGKPWLVLEYVPSRSLGSILAEQRVLHPAQVAHVGAQVAAGLAAAHAAGIVHRDVKPDNVLVARPPVDGGMPVWPVAKLTDFGISHTMETPSLTTTGVVTGTPSYFAPETARSDGGDAPSDVYSLGATLYAAVEGHPPFGSGAENVLVLLARIARGGAPAPQQAGPLTDVLCQLIADDPAARPTAEQAAQALQAVAAAHGGPPAGGSVGVPVLPQAASGSRGGVLAAVFALLLVASVITAIGLIAVTAGPPEHPRDDDSVVVSDPRPATDAAPAAPTVGDPRTTDPCSLVDAAMLGRFGETLVDADSQAFSECSVNITLPSDVGVTFWVDLEGMSAADPLTSGVPTEQVDGTTILRYPPGVASCQRTLVLEDGNVVDVHAEFDDGTEPGDITTVCSIADVGASAAVAAIEDDRIRRRDPAVYLRSLADLGACDVLDQTDLQQLEGKPVPRVVELVSDAGWSCSFEVDDGATEYTPEVAFYRRPPLDESDGTLVSVGGRPAAYGTPPEAESCEVQIVQDSYMGADGLPREIVVKVAVYGPLPEAPRCDYARRAADLVAAKLPPA